MFIAVDFEKVVYDDHEDCGEAEEERERIEGAVGNHCCWFEIETFVRCDLFAMGFRRS